MGANYKTYKVMKGDTLSGIALQYGSTVGELAQLNGISNPNVIQAGSVIKIPTSNTGNSGSSSTGSSTESKPFTYDDFTYGDFSYGAYNKSSAVTNAMNNKTKAENALANYGNFNYSNQASFDEIMNKILNREKFSYDLNGDALYQQYKDKYTKQGKLAMQDTMGQAAAMTGGYGNSYASTAGNQAYQAHLENLNDIVPELYQMALDKYNMEGQDLYNQYGMLSDDRNYQYGVWSDGYNRLASDRDYYANSYYNERDFDYNKYTDDRNFAYNQYSADRSHAYDVYSNDKSYAYQTHRDTIADEQWEKEFAEAQRQYNENLKLQQDQFAWQQSQANKSSSSSSSGGGGGGGNGNGNSGGSYADTLWYATGTYDDNGNPVFRNSDGKTQSFGKGINPYTGAKHSDAKYGTFSNGYQPNNIGGTKLKNSGMSTSITGKNQTIWEANGKYWLWRGDLNKYQQVDISDLK